MAVTKLDELTYPLIRKLIDEGCRTLILPVGTLEAHGLHAPVGTDNFCAEEFAWQLGDRLGYPVAPTLNYGITTGLIAYPGGVRIPKPLYADLCRTILLDFLEMGFRRIIIMNGHGGNTESLSNVIKDLIVEDRGNRHFILIDWWQLDHEALEKIYGRPGGHAALDETAAIIAFRPGLVNEKAFKSENQVAFTPGIVSAPYSAAMLVYEEGDASPDFSPEKAEYFVSLILDKMAALVRHEIELFKSSFGDWKV